MNDPHSPYFIDIEARTVKHKPTGVVMRFDPHPEGGWEGFAVEGTVPSNLTPAYLAGLSRRIGDAWRLGILQHQKGNR